MSRWSMESQAEVVAPATCILINCLYDCQRSRVPVLAIAAQIPNDSRILSTSARNSHLNRGAV